ncbi:MULTISPECIES: PepSY-associated TM helix domain-containing protein [Methylosinus]|uniref:PepSY domain-containing protein n=1 Tax=Methylosinus trichosporium (strain ATCC 35070 / NCIMB 11131 / UNIQEM 75 / OB3b) TaxID=595536 RepID=A0A2D2D5T2_METT3|nr:MULTISPECIES: PepSY-associated TM helix domain-containing protein [Methylosinus]ATQ70199.1 PepSY domain-containing protein [Methylosinus trichosporium OB3b]OBS54077.1 peptidase M4 [Methylosinus sp. 3S-1]
MRRREVARKILLSIHRMIGLFGGAVFVVVALSGGLLAFREDIDEWLNAPMMRVDPPAEATARTLDEMFAAAIAAMPPDAKPERLTTPRHARAAAAINYLVETDDLETDVHQIFVDPYRAKVTGQRLLLHGEDQLSQPFVPILMAFHWTLLLGVANAFLIGALGVAVFVSILIGLFLWRPRNGDWRLGLKIKWGASQERIAYDAHRSVGLYFSAILLVTLLTGVAMIFKPMTRAATSLFSPVRAEPDFGRSSIDAGAAPIGLDAAVAAADKALPGGRLHWILLPSGPEGVYVVGKQSDDEPNRTKTYRNAGVDQYSGRILQVQDRGDFSAGERVLEWLFPLHSGEAFGVIGRPLMLLVGAAPLVLFATGVLRWRQKRARKRPS